MNNKILSAGKGVLLLAAVFSLTVAGCKKEVFDEVPSARDGELRCTPYRNLDNYYQMGPELTTLANCMVPACSNAAYLYDTRSFNYNFGWVGASPTAQNTVLLDGRNWANATKPAGYVVYRLEFTTVSVYFGISIGYVVNMSVKATYMKCSDPPVHS